MGKHKGMAYLSLGIFVNHKYNYSVTDRHVNDISRHFTPKLIKYLRTFEGNSPSKLTKPDDLLALVGTS